MKEAEAGKWKNLNFFHWKKNKNKQLDLCSVACLDSERSKESEEKSVCNMNVEEMEEEEDELTARKKNTGDESNVGNKQ